MKKCMRFLATIASAILGLFSGLAGCNTSEDVLYMGPAPSVSGKVLDSSTDQGLADLRVELLKNNILIGTYTTKSDGGYGFSIRNEDTNTDLIIRINDIDGAANGEYYGLTNTIQVSGILRTNFKLDKK